MSALLREVEKALVESVANELAAELDEAKGALAEMVVALNAMPEECRIRTPGVPVAMARAKKILGIEG